MALILKISLEERVGSFVIDNCTGEWQSDYPWGFGMPTVLTQWVTGVTAYATPPNSPASILLNLDTSFVQPDGKWQVMPWDLGGRKEIESGLWTVEVVIEGTTDKNIPFTYRAVTKKVFTKEVECCVDKMTSNTLNVSPANVFSDPQSKTTAELSALLNRALKAVCCGNTEAADRIVTYIKLNCRCGCKH